MSNQTSDTRANAVGVKLLRSWQQKGTWFVLFLPYRLPCVIVRLLLKCFTQLLLFSYYLFSLRIYQLFLLLNSPKE